MYEKEINIYQWKVSSDLEIFKIELGGIVSSEAEVIINIMKQGKNKKPEISIDCSYQNYITKFQKSQIFTLTSITISTIRNDEKLGGFVLAIQGSMPLKGISIRKKTYFLSEKEKERKKNLIRNVRKKDIKLKK